MYDRLSPKMFPKDFVDCLEEIRLFLSNENIIEENNQLRDRK